jgi:hypothetical protein
MDMPGGENVTGQGFGATTAQDSGPIVSSDTGIVNTGVSPTDFTPTASQPDIVGNDFSALGAQNQPSFMSQITGAPNVTSTTPFAPADTNLAGEIGLGNDFTSTAPASFADTAPGVAPIDSAAAGGLPTNVAASPPSWFDTTAPGVAPAGGGGVLSPTASATPAGFAPTDAELSGATTGTMNPVTAGAMNPGDAAATTAGGGTSALNALRLGAAGLNVVTGGINLANALNQPSYPALMPGAYPGGPLAPQTTSPANQFAPGTITTGGVAGGLAANRLAIGLVSGASPQQLAQSGIISQQRATTLQNTYSGISQQYAAQLGISPQRLSPGVKQLIAAQALADAGLGGR